MSIHEIIKELVAKQELFHLPSWIPSQEMKRCVYVSPEIWAQVNESTDNREGRVLARLRQHFDAFSGGRLFTVAEDPFDKGRTAMLARTDPVQDEFWSMRVIDPNPGVRAFGAFSGTNEFVALTCEFRHKLAGRNENRFETEPPKQSFDAEITRCRAYWKKLFLTYPPHRGDRLSDYISENYQPI